MSDVWVLGNPLYEQWRKLCKPGDVVRLYYSKKTATVIRGTGKVGLFNELSALCVNECGTVSEEFLLDCQVLSSLKQD